MTGGATVAAATAAIVLSVLAVLQVLVASGRPYGRFVWGGAHETLPLRLRVGSAVSVILYAGIAGILIARAGWFGTPGYFVMVAGWIVVAYFAIGIVMNGLSRSRPERLVMTPTCLVLTACSLIIALS